MTDFQELFLKTSLFSKVPELIAREYVKSIDVKGMSYEKGGILLMQGEPVSRIGVVVAGRAVGERIRSDGFAVTVNELQKGDMFGDVLSGSSAVSPVTIRAESRVQAIYVELSELLTPKPQYAIAASGVIKALIEEISNKYFAQNERIMILTAGSIRSRAARYLIKNSKGEREFRVPHDREAMARYLGVDRSALSRELSRLKEAGLIDYKRANFTLLDPEALSEM